MKSADQARTKQVVKLPLLLAAAGVSLGLPSAGLAVVALSNNSQASSSIEIFTPASVDPQLAKRVASRSGEAGIRFTPATPAKVRDRSVFVAVRVDGDAARAISVRDAIASANASGNGAPIAAIAPTKYNLEIARGYQGFARPVALPSSVRKLEMPDLAEFQPSASKLPKKKSRFQPRIALEDREHAGRSKGTIEGLGSQSVELGGAYRVMRNLDVSAGVRISKERDRLQPLTDAEADNQAVYVATQFRF